MARVNLYDITGKLLNTVEIGDAVFGIRPNESVVHQYVKMQLANRRAGTHSALTRGEVSGTTAKPWRQKGTGRARSGSVKSPVWVHGGIVFPPKPRDYEQKMPRKVKKLAVKSVLSQKVTDERLFVLNALEMAQPMTKTIASMLNTMGLKSAVIIDHDMSESAKKSIRNIKNVKYLSLSGDVDNGISGLSVYDMLKYKNVVITSRAVSKVEEVYSK
ncbi:MAG: 50S ribosomal protein L4 [Candidatus Wallbacteria bacterium HGW-Wallbacteria-1]|jgi:large subunit ribosomal protein L4|uniref:Large ribosomal subunit protein uL4 n=1 Tax=Candidatus Wallbacteria bacterium HGW-Wallbacteria-1 TaxID=2013854 RepID=A0A2N1PT33_9BACT|nr:MAG: 50S ribosomal protein L4 [Candidatus Wallbacteria bacterium HGW-Wallbacteria-1]